MKLSLFLLGFLLAGCVFTSANNEETQIPVFPQMVFDPDILLTARLGGTLEQRRKCLAIANGDGSYFTPVWPKQSNLRKDTRALFYNRHPV